MKKSKLKIKVINPPSEEKKIEIIKELTNTIQEEYYS